jgi:hypothetical protein
MFLVATFVNTSFATACDRFHSLLDKVHGIKTDQLRGHHRLPHAGQLIKCLDVLNFKAFGHRSLFQSLQVHDFFGKKGSDVVISYIELFLDAAELCF